MSQIEIYTTDFCSSCRAAKRLLDELGVEYTEIYLGRDHEGRVALAERTGLLTFPQVVIDGKPLGGYEHLRAAIDRGELDALPVGNP